MESENPRNRHSRESILAFSFSFFKIPERIKTARQLNVKIDRKHILIEEKGSAEPIIDLDLLKDIKTESAQWSFEVDEHLVG